MDDLIQRFLATAGRDAFTRCTMGLEKESLRVNPRGGIAQTPHPAALGAALTHPWITTDYSEALIELITPPVASPDEALRWLRELHRYVYRHIGDEYLWATSMPCIVAGESSVPIARYGSSNAGRMKHVYRVGLGYRYGRVMQSIAGVHFNFSLPDDFWATLQRLEGDTRPRQEYVAERYFGLIRNLKRVGWLVIYLFGASPAVCKSFLTEGRSTWLQEFDESTLYGPFATSLRMGDIGYQNNKEHGSRVRPSYNSLAEYVAALGEAITTPSEKYERIGVKVDGEYRQLNANLLQIENEYYSTVRPKQICEGYEKPTHALTRRGVRYIELRSLDVNAFEPLGISAAQMRVLHTLMLWCLFRESPPIEHHERISIDRNELAVAHRGREPGLCLMRAQDEMGMQEWAREILEGMARIAALLDGGGTGPHQVALAAQRAAVDDPSLTPSARMLHDMRDRAESFHEIAKRLSMTHRQQFLGATADAEISPQLDAMAASSLAKQRRMEEEEAGESFDQFLERYFAQKL